MIGRFIRALERIAENSEAIAMGFEKLSEQIDTLADNTNAIATMLDSDPRQTVAAIDRLERTLATMKGWNNAR